MVRALTGSSTGFASFAGPYIRIPSPRVAWPSVGVVIVTANRPNLVRRALTSVAAQDYPGALRVVVVCDGSAPDWRLAAGGNRPVLVLENWRTPGRSGARNTGILAAGDCELVAICDDDDVWSPGKLTAQVWALRHTPHAVLATCAHEVEYDGTRSHRLAERDRMGVRDVAGRLRRDLRASGFVAIQSALATGPARGGIGLLNESAPPDAEEWDLLLRAAKRGPVAHVDQPLLRMLWRQTDLRPGACARQSRAMRWVLERHPDLLGDRTTLARIAAEIAWWSAGAGDWTGSRQWTMTAVRARWWRADGAVAAAAAAGLVRGRVLRALLRRTL